MGLENARVENDGQKLPGLENAGLENDRQTFSKLLAKLRGLENAELENDGQHRRAAAAAQRSSYVSHNSS